MDQLLVLKAISDESRMKILTLLLQHNYCVRALARKLNLSEAAISQHIKILRDAGLLMGKKQGYFMHYDVNRSALHELAAHIEGLTAIKRENCNSENGGCHKTERERCHIQKQICSSEAKELCHGENTGTRGEERHEHCHCHKS